MQQLPRAPKQPQDETKDILSTQHCTGGKDASRLHTQKAEVFDQGPLYLEPQQWHWHNPTSYCHLTRATELWENYSALLKSLQPKSRAVYRGSDTQDKGKAGLIYYDPHIHRTDDAQDTSAP